MLINPYIILICNDGSEADIKEVYFNNNCWTNAFLEAYIEPSATLSFSRVQKSMNNSIKTASFNCHLKKDSKLSQKYMNFRVFCQNFSKKTQFFDEKIDNFSGFSSQKM